jgi:hypothetical protein
MHLGPNIAAVTIYVLLLSNLKTAALHLEACKLPVFPEVKYTLLSNIGMYMHLGPNKAAVAF